MTGQPEADSGEEKKGAWPPSFFLGTAENKGFSGDVLRVFSVICHGARHITTAHRNIADMVVGCSPSNGGSFDE